MPSYRKLAMRALGRPLHTERDNKSPRPASQRAAAFILTAALLTGTAFPAFAGTYFIEDGDIVISAGTEAGTNKVEQGGTLKSANDMGTIITNREEGASSNTVTIEANGENDKVEVTLKDLNIDATSRGYKDSKDTGEAAVSVTGKGDTNIELDGDNELKSGYYHAGLEHNQTVDGEGNVTSGKLTIQDKNNDGSLDATGGRGGAGIGGSNENAGQVTITGGNITATGGKQAAGIGGGYCGNGDVTISGNAKIENATGGNGAAGIGGGDSHGNGNVTISGNAKIENAQGGKAGAGIGGGYAGLGDVTIEGNTMVNATGGAGSAGIGGGFYAKNNDDGTGNKITIKSNENGSPTINAVGGGTDEMKKVFIGGAGIGAGYDSNADTDITLEGKVTITATAGKDNVAIGAIGSELDLDTIKEKLGPGAKVTTTDANGVTKEVSIPRPVEPEGPVIPEESSSSSDGGSATPSAPASPLPGLTVTDKDGQRISYTSIRDNNVLSLRVGRFTASFRISLAALRQLRAEGIDTITFQTVLCSTTLSVDELLAMGGEDAEAVLTHRLTVSSLTVG